MQMATVSVQINSQHPAPALVPQLVTPRWETCETFNYKGADFALLTNHGKRRQCVASQLQARGSG